ncbi:hypothetical protein CBM2599_B50376 [Cupriavidus taiwanensis]|nr:hypothetical protein CBM2600_B10616 [Cupriavidus taiwanensis]SOY96444.1 hypothetical protein CBM2599_B50376 [Cupriavidus taiwanensis]
MPGCLGCETIAPGPGSFILNLSFITKLRADSVNRVNASLGGGQ